MLNFNDGPDILARTIWGEARGESRDGKVAVACVVRNRAQSKTSWWRKAEGVTDPFAAVCLCPRQFSCWNPSDPNLKKIKALTLEDPVFQECAAIANAVIIGSLPDITDGATHYYANRMKKPPSWAGVLTVTRSIGGHMFLRDR